MPSEIARWGINQLDIPFTDGHLVAEPQYLALPSFSVCFGVCSSFLLPIPIIVFCGAQRTTQKAWSKSHIKHTIALLSSGNTTHTAINSNPYHIQRFDALGRRYCTPPKTGLSADLVSGAVAAKHCFV